MEEFKSKRILAGRYRILKEIGKGRFGTVYRGEDTKLGTPVAVKELDPLWCRDPKAMARFTREAKVAARLNHPNIVRVHDIFEEEGTYFLVMDYIVGESLKELLAEGKPLPLEQVVDIVRQVASALDYAHEQGVIHRDLKPSNIIIEKGTGRIFVTDFGLAKVPGEPGLSSTGEVIGSPEYMAPEQARGKPEHRSDIYSLGVLLFKMCTGRVPFTGEEPLAVLHAHAEEPVPSVRELNPALPEETEDVIRRALAKHPVDRYQRAGELARALEWVTSEEVERKPLPLKREREIAPKLQMVPHLLDFGFVRGSESMTLTIINTGSESVSGTITSDKPWAHASPSSFTISGSQTITIKVSVSTYEIEKILLGLLVPFIHKANLLIQFDRDQVYIPVKMRGWFSESYSLSYDLFMLAFFATIFSLGMLPALYFTLLLVDSLTWRLPKVTRWVIGIIAALVVLLFGCAILPRCWHPQK